MSVQFRPITGREDGDWFDEEEPFRIPPSYMLVDNGLVWAWSPNGCYRCSFRYLESAMVFTFLDRWGYRHDRIVAWNVLDDMGFLSRAFKIQIGRELSVRTNYSKLMGKATWPSTVHTAAPSRESTSSSTTTSAGAAYSPTRDTIRSPSRSKDSRFSPGTSRERTGGRSRTRSRAMSPHAGSWRTSRSVSTRPPRHGILRHGTLRQDHKAMTP